MASNSVSYRRFTALPPNIAEYGTTVEELALQRGAPDPNPILSPMAEQRLSGLRLALAPAGSDRLRLQTPVEPQANPYEGPRSNLVLARSALKKLTGNVLGEMQRAVQTADVNAETKALMNDSIRRALVGLGEHLADSIRLSEGVYARCIAASKG